MGCLALLGIIGLLFFGVRLNAPVAIATTVEAPIIVEALPMTPTPTPITLITATFGAEGATPVDLLTAAEAIRARLALFEIDGATVLVTANADNPRLVVQVPSTVDDPASLFSLLAAPGYLELVDLSGLDANALFEMEGETLWTTGQARAFGGEAPEGAQVQPETGKPFETIIDGFLILQAESYLDDYDQWTVQVGFDGSGALRLEEFTGAHIGDALGIVIDGRLISAPIINNEIGGGELVVVGNFTEKEAHDLSVQFGTVPLRIRLELLDVS